MPDSIQIPEIQKVKEQYPQYKDIPDYEVLQSLAKAYPVYQKPLSKVDSRMQKKENWDVGTESFKNNIINGSSELLPDALVGLGNVPLGRTLRHAWGGVQAAVSGENPVEGFKNPDQQQPFGVSYAKAENLDLNKPLDFTLATIADVSANLLTGHLLYGAPVKAAVDAYTGIQSSAMKDLKSTIHKEFVQAGASHNQAGDLASHVVNKINTQGFLKNNPVAVNMLRRRIDGKLGGAIVDHLNMAKSNATSQGTPDIFKRLASRINSLIDVNPLAPSPKFPVPVIQDQTIRPPVSSKFERTNYLPDGTGTIVTPPKGHLETTPPQTDFGRQIQTQLQEKYNIPLHPASEGRIAVANLLRNQQIPPTTQPPPKPTASPVALQTKGGGEKTVGGDPTVEPKNKSGVTISKIAKLSISPIKPQEIIKSPDIADEVLQRQGNQAPDTIKLAQGIKTIPTPDIPKTTEKPSARMLAQQKRMQDIKDRAEKYHPNTFWDVTFVDDYGAHNTMVDGPGLKLLESKAKVTNKSKLTSEKGELDLQPLHDLLTNIHGELEKGNNEFRYVAKMFGNSFFIGEKYPPFKKVLDSLQNPIDESNEFFYNGVKMLDRKHGESLSPALQERINQALNYGDSQSIQKYFNDDELRQKFNMSDTEIQAYQGVVKMYKYGLEIAKATRKLEIGFSDLSDKEKDYTQTKLNDEMDRIGGYLSHTRLGGDWAVYQPGEGENDQPKFFDLFGSKAEAEKTSKILPGSKVYLKTNIPREYFGKMSIHDLESLAEAQDIDKSSPDYLSLKEELMKRTANRQWIRRNWIPRSEQLLKDKYDNAIDYLNGQTSKYARVKGRIDAQKAFNDNAKLMSPSLAKYAKSLMDIHYSGTSQDSNKVFQALNKTVYAYRLMFKTSFFLQHLTHPISVTYPELAKGVDNLKTEKMFFDAYSMSRRYALNKITGSSYGLSKDTLSMMDSLHKQGYLGDQLNKFQLDSRTRVRTGIEHFLGSMARVSEGTNRVHSAMAGMLKADHMGITDPKMREDYVKNFMKKTVFLYGKLYTPTVVTGAGNLKSLMNTMYRFRSFEVNYLHTLASHFRYGPSSYLRAIGGMTAMAGIAGAPFFALLTMAYLWKTGHTLDNDMRESAQEAHVPDKAYDLALHGVPSLAGADLSSLIGTADIVSPYGDPMSKIGGASVGFAEQIAQGVHYLSTGDRQRAMEKLSPDFISRILRAQRYAREGIKKENGDTILANPSKFDTIISSLGIQPLDFTKAYEARDAKDAIQSSEEKKSAQYNEILAKTIHDKNIGKYKDILDKIIDHNKSAKEEDQINISTVGVRDAYKKMLDGKKYPRHMKMIISQINKRYGLEK